MRPAHTPDTNTIVTHYGHVGENTLAYLRAEFHRLTRERDALRVQYDELRLEHDSLKARHDAITARTS